MKEWEDGMDGGAERMMEDEGGGGGDGAVPFCKWAGLGWAVQ